MRSIDGEVPAIHPPNQAFRPRNVSGAIFCVRIIARQVKGDSKMGKNEKTKKPKPKYNVWQNTAYMLSVAWDTRRSVPLLVVLLAVCTAGKTTAEMLISPAVLGKLESGASLGQLLGAIGGFTILLFALTALCYYIDHLTMFGRCGVRLELLKRINTKRTRTAYANLLDEAFRLMYQKGHDACMNNRASGEAFWKSWTDIMTNLIGFGVYLALLSGLNPWLCVLTALTAVVSYFSTRNINEWGYRHREEGAKITRSLHYLRNTAEGREFGKDIRIFGLRQWLTDLYDSALRLNYAFLEKRERAYLTANLIDLALLLVRNGAAYAYLLWLTVTRGLPVSEFLLYFGAASGFAQWVTGLMEQFALLRKQSLDIFTIREFLELPEPFRFEEGIPLEKRLDMPYELQLEDVSYRYPGAEKNTIAHMSLTLHPGENLAIVGLNGAGKTTLVKLICGFLDPTGGRVLLNGQDIRQYNRRDYYKLFEAVFQDFSVLSCTVAENVAQAMDGIDEEKVRYCLDQAGLTEKITSLPAGIKTHVGRDVYLDGVEFSGGQTQRLMLARALYKDAPILVLDEPTAALDPIAEDDIYQKYNEMTRGRTSLFISHRLASTRFCDRILFLENGRVVEEGTHDQLMAQNGGYAKLFAVQSKYYKEGKAV